MLSSRFLEEKIHISHRTNQSGLNKSKIKSTQRNHYGSSIFYVNGYITQKSDVTPPKNVTISPFLTIKNKVIHQAPEPISDPIRNLLTPFPLIVISTSEYERRFTLPIIIPLYGCMVNNERGGHCLFQFCYRLYIIFWTKII